MKQYVEAINAEKSFFRKAVKSFIYFSILMLILGSIVLGFVWLREALALRAEQRKELEVLKSELSTLKEKNSNYREAVKKLYQDEYIELLARKEFKYVSPGEKAYIVVLPEELESKKEKDNGEVKVGEIVDFLISK